MGRIWAYVVEAQEVPLVLKSSYLVPAGTTMAAYFSKLEQSSHTALVLLSYKTTRLIIDKALASTQLNLGDTPGSGNSS